MDLPDFKPGPLDFYRQKASFDWKKFKVFLDGEDMIKYQNEVSEVLRNHPDFSFKDDEIPDLDTLRKLTFRQALALKSTGYFAIENYYQDPRKLIANCRIMWSLHPAADVKLANMYHFFASPIVSLGTDRHSHFLEENLEDKIRGSYCMTEVGHGSNARGMKTYATYDKEKKVFVLNSPNFEAAKCWAGGLGQTATHATVFAQLVLDGKNHGLHTFVVPLRNPNTLIPCPGVTVGDLGEKIGLNGIDNGFMMFKDYEIPRENLLNKISDVTEDGRYVTALKDPSKRHGASLGTLSLPRISVSIVSEVMQIKALTIAIRYAAVRKQFGPNDHEEVAILEYQSHQHRLLPYLAAAYVIRNFNNYLPIVFHDFMIATTTGEDEKYISDLGLEIHATASACKAVSGWITKEAIQECREACGGHGYLKVAGIGDIRNDFDANLTYDGENHVLIQQTSNWLLKFWPKVLQKENISSPLQSLDFLTGGLDILTRSRFTSHEDILRPESIIKAYQWLVVHLLKRTYEKFEGEIKSGKGQFWAKSNTQVYYAKTLAIVFIQHVYLQRMLITIQRSTEASIRNVLTKLCSLYGLFSLEKHISYLYEGGYATGSEITSLIHEGVLKMCAELKNDAVALIDVVAPPDFMLNSVLGMSDGEVYKHLEAAMTRSPGAFTRPSWWKEIVNYDKLKNKL